MKVQPVASPHAINPGNSNPTSQSDARARAIARLSGDAPATSSQPAQQTVQNQNSISVEEMGAIIPQPNLMASEESTQADNGQTDTPEQPKEKTQEETALSRQFAQLARQEKQWRQRMKDLEVRESALKARETPQQPSAPAQAPERTYSEARLKQDPLSVLAEIGLDYNQLTEQVLNQQPQDPRTQATIQRLESKILELESKATKIEESGKAAQDQQYQAAVKQITADVNKLVFTDNTFETIKATGSQRDVVELIEETFKDTGNVMSIEEACQQVEDYLVEEAYKLAKLDKIQKRMAPSATPTAPGQTASVAKPQTQPTMKTLTNAASASRPTTSRERAIAAFKGEKIS